MEEQTRNHQDDTVQVHVTWPSADEPVNGEFQLSDAVSKVRDFAMLELGLQEGTVDGNQVKYYLYQGGSKLTELSQTLAELWEGHQHTMVFRLVRDLIAG